MNNDGFDMEDLDDEKTIAYIRQRLPQELKEKFSDDEFYFFLDTIMTTTTRADFWTTTTSMSILT